MSKLPIKKIVIGIVIAVGLVIAIQFGMMFFILSGLFSTGISVEDRVEAIAFCEKLFVTTEIKSNSNKYISFDDMPINLKETAPAAIADINFSLKGSANNYICCFSSTESGNADWGYRDCLHQREGEESRLNTKVKTIGGYSDCSSPSREWHSYKGKKVCVG